MVLARREAGINEVDYRKTFEYAYSADEEQFDLLWNGK